MKRSVLRWAALGVALAAGLIVTPSSAQLWEPGNRLLLSGSGDPAAAEFEHTLVVGDSDGDGLDDVAAAAPFRDIASFGLDDAGEVEVFLGRPGRTLVSDLRTTAARTASGSAGRSPPATSTATAGAISRSASPGATGRTSSPPAPCRST